eukprot:757768-Hanusia_phi.AAC.4
MAGPQASSGIDRPWLERSTPSYPSSAKLFLESTLIKNKLMHNRCLSHLSKYQQQSSSLAPPLSSPPAPALLPFLPVHSPSPMHWERPNEGFNSIEIQWFNSNELESRFD